jgi:hypothetical protein
MDEKATERMDDKRAVEIGVTLRSAHRGGDHLFAFRHDIADAAVEMDRARASEAALVAEVRRLRGRLERIGEVAAESARILVHDAALREALGRVAALAEDLAPSPLCPKGHGPMIRVECCPRCAEDVPGVTG